MKKSVSWKAVILCPVIYIIVMGAANYYTHHRYKAIYSEPLYLKVMLPFFVVLCVATLASWLFFGKKISPPKGTNKIPVYYLVFFIPLASVMVTSVMPRGGNNTGLITAFAVAVLVGIAEELMFRRIVYAGLRQKMSSYDYKWPVAISASFFAVLHSVNVFAGMSLTSTATQVIMTFFAGLFYALMYDYTGKIGLMIILHTLWDYVLLTDSFETHSVFMGFIVMTVMAALSVIEFILIVILIVRKELEIRKSGVL